MAVVGVTILVVTAPALGAASTALASGQDTPVVTAPSEITNSASSNDSTSSSDLTIDAEITSFAYDTGQYVTGDEVNVVVYVKNTGDSEHTFFVGYSVRGPNGDYYDNGGTTGEQVTLNPGEEIALTLTWTVEDNAPTGWYDHIVKVWKESDPNNLETTLDSRTASSAFEKIETNIDASINSFDAPSGTYTIGDTVSGTVTVENTGNVEHTYYVGFSVYDSNGNVYDNDGSTGEAVTLSPGEQTTVTVSWDSSEGPADTYDARASVWEESDPSNLNNRLADEVVTNAFTLEGDVDAQIRSFDAPSGTYSIGDTVSGTITVENTGNVEHTYYVGFSVYDSNGNVYDNDGSTGEAVTLSPGEQTTVSVSWDSSEGPADTYDARASVWEESDPSNLNNRLADELVSDAFTLEGDIDAQIRSFDAPSGTYTIGDTVSGSVTVENTGNVEHTYYVGFSVYDSNGNVYDNDGSTGQAVTLSPGEQTTVTVSWDSSEAPADTYDARVSVWEESDPSNLQTRLTDQVASDTFTLDGDVDASIVDYDPPTGTYSIGETVSASVTVANSGEVEHTYYVGYSVVDSDGNYYDNGKTTGTTVTLAPGEETTVAVEWDSSEGPADTYGARVSVWKESDTNNLQTRLADQIVYDTFTLEGDVDASILEYYPPSGTYSVGETVSGTVTVANTGQEEQTYYIGYSVIDSDGNYYDNGKTTGTTVTLAPGEESTVTVRWDSSEGLPDTYDARVSVWAESDPSNLQTRLADRTASDTFTLDGDVDARISSFAPESGEFTPGEAVNASVTVENTGTTEHTYFVGYSVEGPNGNLWDNDGSTGTPVTLDPGETRTVSVSWEVPPDAPSGSYTAITSIWAESDSDTLDTRLDIAGEGSAFEVVETTVVDARITSISSASGEFTSGDSVGIAVTIENRGSTEHTFYVGYSVSGPNGNRWNEDGYADSSVTLDPGETQTLQLAWSVADEALEGNYDVSASVYADRNSDGVTQELATAEKQSVFTVADEDANATVQVVTEPGGTYTPGDSVSTEVQLQNTGSSEQRYTISYSLVGPDGSLGEEATEVSVALEAGGQRSITLSRTVPDTAVAGTYGVVIKVLTKRDGQTNTVASTELSDALEITESAIRFEDVTYDTPTYRSGDVATGTVSISNTDDEPRSVAVAVTALDPTGQSYEVAAPEQHELTVAPDSSAQVEFTWNVQETFPIGTYDTRVVVWPTEASRTASNTLVDVRREETFEIAEQIEDRATISQLSTERQTYLPDDTVTVSTEVENNGQQARTFTVTTTFRLPDGSTPQSLERTQTIRLEPGNDRTLRFDHSLPSNAVTGQYDIIVTVAEDSTEVVSKVTPEAFRVTLGDVDRVSLDYVSVSDWGWQAGEEVPLTVGVSNSQRQSERLGIRYKLRGPNDEIYTPDDNVVVVDLDAYDHTQLDLQIPIREQYPDGQYDVIVTAESPQSSTEATTFARSVSRNAFMVESGGDATITIEPAGDFSAIVDLRLDGERIAMDTMVNGDSVSFDELAAGEYIVQYQTIEIGGGESVTREVNLEDGETRTIKISPDKAALDGQVRIDGNLLRHAELEISGHTVSTQENGNFEIGPKLSPGDHTLIIRYNDRVVHRELVQLTAGENEKDINIQYLDSTPNDEFDTGEVMLGFACGEICYHGEEHANAEYMIGWLISSAHPAGDVRDLFGTVPRGDVVGTGITLIGLIPYYGDSISGTRKIVRFLKDAPPREIYRVRAIIRESDIKRKDEILSIIRQRTNPKEVLRSEFDLGSSVTRNLGESSASRLRMAGGQLRELGYSDDTIRNFLRRNADSPQKVEELADASRAFKRSFGRRPQTEGELLEGVWLNRVQQSNDAQIASTHTGINSVDDLQPGETYVAHSVDIPGNYEGGELDVVLFRVDNSGRPSVVKAYEAGTGSNKLDDQGDQLQTNIERAKESGSSSHNYLDSDAFSRTADEDMYGGYVGLTDEYDIDITTRSAPDSDFPVYTKDEFSSMSRDLELQQSRIVLDLDHRSLSEARGHG